MSAETREEQHLDYRELVEGFLGMVRRFRDQYREPGLVHAADHAQFQRRKGYLLERIEEIRAEWANILRPSDRRDPMIAQLHAQYETAYQIAKKIAKDYVRIMNAQPDYIRTNDGNYVYRGPRRPRSASRRSRGGGARRRRTTRRRQA